MEDNKHPEPDRGTALAETRTNLSLQRTIMAGERTLMAWIRTSVSLIGFGFTIYKFLQYLREGERLFHLARPHAPRNFALALIVLGTVALIAAVWQHRGFLAQIGAAQPRYMWSLTVIIAILVTLIGVLAVVGVLLRAGPF
jgi:putative membrane protein